MISSKNQLRKEQSISCSGLLLNEKKIPFLSPKDYFVENIPLDGDAPKQFIRVYEFFKESGIRRKNPKTWIPYIAKTAEKWYPHESVIEYMINRIGQELNLTLNDVAIFKINGQIRFLSKYFLKKNETLVHGAEICGEYLDDMEMAAKIANERATSRQLFTFEFIQRAIEFKFGDQGSDLIKELVKMIAFDGLVGNNDRHFYNWGIIANTKKVGTIPRLAPLYDSARGLLWNNSDEWIIKHLEAMGHGGRKVENYIESACPRISIDGDSEINHFGLIKYLKNLNTEFKVIISELASEENEHQVLEMLKMEFFCFFIPERCKLIEHIIKERFKRIREE
ncbi:HipA domain-containing protein [Algoriphagus sp. A40]|uniref:HipA domain-containing protein n=1 Tax=Algoriphagus sp. A40 TaxID=1945863 RepID=UPI0011159606|nr:HipA domain-containing protein [Algoriphagus sp. A40]